MPRSSKTALAAFRKGEHSPVAEVIRCLIHALPDHDRRNAVFHGLGEQLTVGVRAAAADERREYGEIACLRGELLPLLVHDLVIGKMLKALRKFRIGRSDIHVHVKAPFCMTRTYTGRRPSRKR